VSPMSVRGRTESGSRARLKCLGEVHFWCFFSESHVSARWDGVGKSSAIYFVYPDLFSMAFCLI